MRGNNTGMCKTYTAIPTIPAHSRTAYQNRRLGQKLNGPRELKGRNDIPLGRFDSVETTCLSGMEAERWSVYAVDWRCKNVVHYFWVLLMFISMLLRRNMLSSNAVVCSAIWPGLAGASLRGSLSTMMSKSSNFSVRVDISFSKQNEYSPTVFAVKT